MQQKKTEYLTIDYGAAQLWYNLKCFDFCVKFQPFAI
jgi:hypothetical protein